MIVQSFKHGGHEFDPEILCGAAAVALGGEDGGEIALVDCAMFVRPREVDLGYGRDSLGRRGPAEALPGVSAVRQVLLADVVS